MTAGFRARSAVSRSGYLRRRDSARLDGPCARRARLIRTWRTESPPVLAMSGMDHQWHVPGRFHLRSPTCVIVSFRSQWCHPSVIEITSTSSSATRSRAFICLSDIRRQAGSGRVGPIQENWLLQIAARLRLCVPPLPHRGSARPKRDTRAELRNATRGRRAACWSIRRRTIGQYSWRRHAGLGASS